MCMYALGCVCVCVCVCVISILPIEIVALYVWLMSCGGPKKSWAGYPDFFIHHHSVNMWPYLLHGFGFREERDGVTTTLWTEKAWNQSIRVSCQILTLATITSSSVFLQILTNSRGGIPVALCSHPRYVRRCRPRDLFPAIRPVKASSSSCSFLNIWHKKRSA